MSNNSKKKTPAKKRKYCGLPQLTTCAYSFASLISMHMNVEQMLRFSVFLNTLADLVIINAEEKKLCENPDDEIAIDEEIIQEDLFSDNNLDFLG